MDPSVVQAWRDEVLPQLEAACLRRRIDLTTAGSHADADRTLVVDRQGWSLELVLQLARQGVACITWRLGELGEDWPEEAPGGVTWTL